MTHPTFPRAVTPVLLLATSLLPAAARAADAPPELYGTLKKIRDSGTITLGHREAYVPFSYLDAEKKPVGYSIDLCLRIVDEIKAELKLADLKVKYAMVTPKTRIETVRSGGADLECSATTHTLGRQREVDFSPTVMISGTRMVVRKGSGALELESLKGKKIAGVTGTTNFKVAQEAVHESGVDIRWVEFKENDLAFRALEKGEVDAAVLEDVAATGLIAKAKEPAKWEIAGRYLSYEPNAFMLRQNDAAFRLVVDRTLSRLFTTGEINRVYDKWFKPLHYPMTDLFRAAIQVQSIPE